MDVAVTGSSGLVGSALVASLRADGHRAVRVVRGDATVSRDAVCWDPPTGTIDAAGLEGLDAVVHLAGAGIGDRRWTDARKRVVLQSRVVGTTLLARTLAGLERPPRVLVSASAVGWYGDRGEEELTEASGPPPHPDFPAEVCAQWEASTAPAEAMGIRTVHLRSGVVLSPRGGMLRRLLTPFRLGLGGRLGSGRQYLSWIALPDQIGVIRRAVDDVSLSGPVNSTSPEPVRNADFTDVLGRVLRRPTGIPTPLAPLRAVYGSELVDSFLLGSQRVLPARLAERGHRVAHPGLEGALRAVLDRPAPGRLG